jgi:ABC-type transport system involved in multi-copper enzyme maturation permease subunit
MKANLYLSFKYAIKNKAIIITLSILVGVLFIISLMGAAFGNSLSGANLDFYEAGYVSIIINLSSLVIMIMAGIISAIIHSDFNKKGIQVVYLSKKNTRTEIFWSRVIVTYLIFMSSSLIINFSIFFPVLFISNIAFRLFLFLFLLSFFISLTILPFCIAVSILLNKTMGIIGPILIYIVPTLLVNIIILIVRNAVESDKYNIWIYSSLDLSIIYLAPTRITYDFIYNEGSSSFYENKNLIQLLWLTLFTGLFVLSYFSFMKKDFK